MRIQSLSRYGEVMQTEIFEGNGGREKSGKGQVVGKEMQGKRYPREYHQGN